MIPIAKPYLDELEADSVRRVVFSGWITQGPEVAAFESEFAGYVGAPHACAVSSCTTALHLALLAAGVGPGHEVITVSHSFIASANSIRYCGATPVFVDVESDTFNIDPDLVEAAISPLTRAILCVHQMGMPCDLNRIAQIAEKHSIPLIEDAACAIGSEILWKGQWEHIGRPHGDAACFSFHPRKIISTGEGGMITTKHQDWDTRFRLLRQHGMSVPDTVRHTGNNVIFESYMELGFNYRMTDLQAAIGREQLKRLPDIVIHRRVMATMYRVFLGDIPNLGLPAEPEWARSNWQSYCVGLPDHCDQRQVMQSLLDQGIASKRGIMCTHRSPAYGVEPWNCSGHGEARSCAPPTCKHLVESERAEDRSLMLPLFTGLSDADQDRVVAAVEDACSRP